MDLRRIRPDNLSKRGFILARRLLIYFVTIGSTSISVEKFCVRSSLPISSNISSRCFLIISSARKISSIGMAARSSSVSPSAGSSDSALTQFLYVLAVHLFSLASWVGLVALLATLFKLLLHHLTEFLYGDFQTSETP